MTLSEKEQSALRAFWLGEPLPKRLAQLLTAGPATSGRRASARLQRQQELRQYLHSLGLELARQTRRLVLSYSPAAVAKLVELMRGENIETARKAAVDLLRLHEPSAEDELAEAAEESALDGQTLAEGLSEQQYRQLLGILADAGPETRRGPAVAELPGMQTDGEIRRGH